MLSDSFLSLRDEKEEQEGSALTRPTDHYCFAKPLFIGCLGILKIVCPVVFNGKMCWAQ